MRYNQKSVKLWEADKLDFCERCKPLRHFVPPPLSVEALGDSFLASPESGYT